MYFVCLISVIYFGYINSLLNIFVSETCVQEGICYEWASLKCSIDGKEETLTPNAGPCACDNMEVLMEQIHEIFEGWIIYNLGSQLTYLPHATPWKLCARPVMYCKQSFQLFKPYQRLTFLEFVFNQTQNLSWNDCTVLLSWCRTTGYLSSVAGCLIFQLLCRSSPQLVMLKCWLYWWWYIYRVWSCCVSFPKPLLSLQGGEGFQIPV